MSKKITHEGELVINDIVLPCYVLEDGTRVLSGRGMQDALKLVDEVNPGKQKPGTRLARFFGYSTLKPFISAKIQRNEPDHFKPIICYRGRQKIHGYEATVLADICDAMLEARKQGVPLTDRQQTIADQCETLIRAFAKVGIIALVDEATGYQHEREKDELQKLLKAYVSPELMPWQKKFPDPFYQEIFRLNGWDYTMKTIKTRPGVVGTWTNKLIYEQLPPGVLKALKERTPKSEAGNYTAKLHQSLTEDIGDPHLQAQLNSVIALMQISRDWKEFLHHYNKMVSRRQGQLELKMEDLQPKEETKKIEEPTLFDTLLKGVLAVPTPKDDSDE